MDLCEFRFPVRLLYNLQITNNYCICTTSSTTPYDNIILLIYSCHLINTKYSGVIMFLWDWATSKQCTIHIAKVMISLLVLTLISTLISFCIYFIYRRVSWRNMIKVVKITLIIQQRMVIHKSCCLIQNRIWTCHALTNNEQHRLSY